MMRLALSLGLLIFAACSPPVFADANDAALAAWLQPTLKRMVQASLKAATDLYA